MNLSVTDLLLLRAADAGDFESRLSRGYDQDNKPEGWPVLVYRGRVVSTDDEGRLGSLENAGYLTWDDEGPVTVTADGNLAALKAALR